MIVVDASLWLYALVDSSKKGDACRKIMSDDPDWVAPAHCQLEVLRALGKLERSNHLSTDAAFHLSAEVCQATVTSYPATEKTLKVIWAFRHNVSVYDAGYVVLAQRFNLPLVTCDEKLAKAVSKLPVKVIVPKSE